MSTLHQHERTSAIIIAAIVLLISVFNVGFSLHVLKARRIAYSQLPQVVTANNEKKVGSAVETRSNGTLDLKERFNAALTQKNQTIHAGLNQQVNFSNGMSFMFTSMQRNWQPATYEYIPKGDYYILLHGVLGNRATFMTTLDFASFSAIINGQTYNYVSTNLLSPAAFSQPTTMLSSSTVDNNVAAGQQIKGVVVLQVPTGSTPTLLIENSGFSHGANQGLVVMKAYIKL